MPAAMWMDRVGQRLGATVGATLGRVGRRLRAWGPGARKSLTIFIDRTQVSQLLRSGSATDGLTSNVVMAPVMWLMRTFCDAQAVVQRRSPDGRLWDRSVDHGLEVLMEQPNPWYDGDALWKATVLSFTLGGNAYWYKVRNRYGQVIQLWYLPHWMVTPMFPLTTTGEFITYYSYVSGIGAPEQIAPRDIVHFRFGLDPENPRLGLSPLRSLWREIGTDDEAAIFAEKILGNMGIPGLIVSPKVDALRPKPDEVEKLREYMSTAFSGDRRGEPLVMTLPTDVSQFGFDPNKLMLGSLRDISEERVCAALGLPAAVIGFGSGQQSTKVGATMRELRRLAWVQALIPMQKTLAKQATSQLMGEFQTQTRRFRVWFDTSDVAGFPEDDDAKAARFATLTGAGILRVDRAQAALGMEVDPEREVYLGPPPAPLEATPPAPPTLPAGAIDEDEDAPGDGESTSGNGSGNGNGSADDKALRAIAARWGLLPRPSGVKELPSPGSGEGDRAFMARCMGSAVMQREFPDHDQRVAVCLRQQRGGKSLTPAATLKFNPNHDERGRFSDGPGARGAVAAGEEPETDEDIEERLRSLEGEFGDTPTRLEAAVRAADADVPPLSHEAALAAWQRDMTGRARQAREERARERAIAEEDRQARASAPEGAIVGQRGPSPLPALADDPRGDEVDTQPLRPWEAALGPDPSRTFRAQAGPMAEFERDRAGKPFETVAVYDDEGQVGVATTQHLPSSAYPPHEVLGATLSTHNHPKPYALSNGDVAGSIASEVGRERATGILPNGDRYVDEVTLGSYQTILRRGRALGWEPSEDTPNGAADIADKAWLTAYTATARKYDNRRRARIAQGMERAEAQHLTESEHTYESATLASRLLGVPYTRTIIPATRRGGGRARKPGSRATRGAR